MWRKIVENIEIWFDNKIKTGEQWNPAISDAIQTSHMIICLISKHYLNSDFIRTREIPGIDQVYEAFNKGVQNDI
ncbi:MAG: toll/interleukin-1 receptor domain-containing protein [Candidatus Magnetomorum sp.]|nr:toll/interleukin-1 receptor domain-containing protein [Candidatus Magnetomorum sp.]